MLLRLVRFPLRNMALGRRVDMGYISIASLSSQFSYCLSRSYQQW